jgi:1-acyl-sn-glycerol-3-phosphate acyltransferase
MISRLRGLVVAVYSGFLMFLCFVTQMPSMIVTGTGDFSIWLARNVWSRSSLWLSGVSLEVSAPYGLPPGPAIFASNHESALDIWALFCVIPHNVRFLAKSELFKIPIFGWYLTLARFIKVDRSNHAKAVQALKRGAEAVRGGISLIVFPEGTRSPDARVQPFKKGPFVLAMEAGVPVVPIAIAGAAALAPKGKIQVRPGTVRVAIGEPAHPRDFTDRNGLLNEVRRRIIQLHLELGGLGGDLDHAIAPRETPSAAAR